MSNIWISSDFHFGHKNICRGESTWKGDGSQNTRDFETVIEMNETLVRGINDNVKSDDVLYFLGDWSFGGINNVWNLRKQLKVATIHFVLGNHDSHMHKVLPNCHDSGIEWQRKMATGLIRKDEPKPKDQRYCYDVKSKELFDSVYDTVTLHLTGLGSFFLSHYAHRVWDKSHHGRYHLFGHSHGSLDHLEWGRSMDVGVDSAFKRFGEYRPFNIKEVIEILDKRSPLIIDHHKPENPS